MQVPKTRMLVSGTRDDFQVFDYPRYPNYTPVYFYSMEIVLFLEYVISALTLAVLLLDRATNISK